MLALNLPALRNLVRDSSPAQRPYARVSDGVAFAGLVLQSAAVILAPISVLAVLALI
jgi:hypothetical protein